MRTRVRPRRRVARLAAVLVAWLAGLGLTVAAGGAQGGAAARRPPPVAFRAAYAAWLAYREDPRVPSAEDLRKVPPGFPRETPHRVMRWDHAALLGFDPGRVAVGRAASFEAYLFTYRAAGALPAAHVVAFKGTEEGRDFVEDGYQLLDILGLRAPQYDLAALLTRRVAYAARRQGVGGAPPGTPVLLAGHSLGGGLATFALGETAHDGGLAYGFNPAQLSRARRDEVIGAARGAAGLARQLRGYRVEGDHVSASGLGYLGHMEVLPYRPLSGWSLPGGLGAVLRGFGSRHYMDAVMRGMLDGATPQARAGACALPSSSWQRLRVLLQRVLVAVALLFLVRLVGHQALLGLRPRGTLGWGVLAVGLLLAVGAYPLVTLIVLAAWVAVELGVAGGVGRLASGCLLAVAAGIYGLLLALQAGSGLLTAVYCALTAPPA